MRKGLFDQKPAAPVAPKPLPVIVPAIVPDVDPNAGSQAPEGPITLIETGRVLEHKSRLWNRKKRGA